MARFSSVLLALLPVVVLSDGLLALRKVVDTNTPDYPQPVFSTGTNFTVTLSMINIGDSPVISATVVDDWPSDRFDLLEGTFKHFFERIAPNEAVSFKLVLAPKFDGNFYIPPAAVQYQPTADAQPQIGFSSGSGVHRVLPAELFYKLTTNQWAEWTVYVLAVAAAIVIPYVKSLPLSA